MALDIRQRKDVGHVLEDVLAVERQEQAGGARADSCRSRQIAVEGRLAEEIAVAQDRQALWLAGRPGPNRFALAVYDQVELLPRLAFLEDGLVGLELLRCQERGEAFEQLRLQVLEDRHAAQPLD